MSNLNSPDIVICRLSGRLAAFQLGQPARPLFIQGQHEVGATSLKEINSACRDLAARLRGEGEDPAVVHWVTDGSDHHGLTFLSELYTIFTSSSFQLLNWHWLSHHQSIKAKQSEQLLSPQDILTEHVVPWLCNQMQTVPETHNSPEQVETLKEQEIELERENRRLQRENEHLKIQNTAVKNVDTEALLHYLPAIFPRVFNILGATDLALLCNRIEAFDIPNPYPEPTVETLRTLQRRFRRLPKQKQIDIVQFIDSIPQSNRLTVRPEMRNTISEIREDLSWA
ncbi:MAG: hypothetical protein AWU57_3746 [Marinobacter sp. T13-3]|nr:MAG: hypothetical protein AWU57_3746 [Marinobacter sp. T13-3]